MPNAKATKMLNVKCQITQRGHNSLYSDVENICHIIQKCKPYLPFIFSKQTTFMGWSRKFSMCHSPIIVGASKLEINPSYFFQAVNGPDFHM